MQVMQRANIETIETFDGVRTMSVACRCDRSHGEHIGTVMELSIVLNGKMSEATARELLLAAWKKHREEKHGGA